jgi:hypothetical protein
MITRIVEVTNDFNWGKFMLCRFTPEEWAQKSVIDTGRPLLRTLGWVPHNLWVLDLQTGEGALFYPGGVSSSDLRKHRIWVCPMFEPFLEWLYAQDLSDLEKIPTPVILKDAPSALYGYRRQGVRRGMK